MERQRPAVGFRDSQGGLGARVVRGRHRQEQPQQGRRLGIPERHAGPARPDRFRRKNGLCAHGDQRVVAGKLEARGFLRGGSEALARL
ncbi:hypothetical protein G6F57_023347 [Rhizopus arrhizus]|nr:hypothetical protein G6F57_023347 [Rhizopus arrhizus]